MSASDLPVNWDPVKEHFKTSNVYQASKVTTRRDGSESDTSDEKERELFIANIPCRVTTDGLINLLGSYGRIQEIKLVPDRKNPQTQLGFVKTYTMADGLRIIEQFNGFKIDNCALRVKVQKPRKMEIPSGSSYPPSSQSSISQLPSSSAPCTRPESAAASVESDHRTGGRMSSSAFGEDRIKPLGRSKLILATVLHYQSQEPSVGQSRAVARATNGCGHRSSQSSSSSDEPGTRELTKIAKQPEAQKLFLESAHKPHDDSSQVPKNLVDKTPTRSQVRRMGTCLKCRKPGDKNCSRCKGIYCSKACQKEDYPLHQLICTPYNRDEEELEKQFGFFIDDVNEPSQKEVEARITVLPLNVPIKVACVVPAFSPSRFYVFPERNQEMLSNLSLRLNEHYAAERNCQKPRSSPDVGDVCACRFSVDDLWYRAEVEDVISRSKVRVRYVDYGNEEEVEISKICELAKEFTSIPNLAVLCSLANIEPVAAGTGCRGWSKEAIQLSQRIIQNCVAVMTPVNLVSGVYYVEMKLNGPDGADLTEQFVKAGVARYPKKPSPFGSMEQLPASKQLLSPNQLPSSKQLPSLKQLPSPNQLPSSEQLLSLKQSPSPRQLPSSNPLTMEPSVGAVNLSTYGWPSDIAHLIGKKMSFEVVEYSPPGDLWVRIDPLPGYETMPLVRLSLMEKYRLTPEPRPSSSCSNPAPLPPKPEAAEPEEPKWCRVMFRDLPPLELKSKLKVEVTLPKNPANFWCHDLLQMAPIIALQNSLKPDTSPLPNSFQPEKGDICFGFYKKYNEWYRVMISERKRDLVDAFLIDYGEDVSIPLHQVRPLASELTAYPPMAFQCQLSVCSSLQTSCSDVIQHFQDLVQNKVIDCKILGRNAATGMHSVVLNDSTSGHSIASILVDAIERKGF